MHQFTEREMQIVRLIAEGLTYEEMGRRLSVSPRRVKQETDVIRSYLGVSKKRRIPQVMRELGLLES